MRKLRIAFLAGLALFPGFVKKPLLRMLFGYRIGRRVRLGISIIDVQECEIKDDVFIGHFNVFTLSKSLKIGDHARIGHFNIIRGGNDVRLGRYSEVIRFNEINSIPDPDVVNPVDPCFILGPGSVITASHKIDFTDRVEFGKQVILGGRNSSLWTHNRQRTKSIAIGDNCYIGSEIRMAPGSGLASNCIVGIGSVITKQLVKPYQLVAGVPAREIKELDDEDRFLTQHKTRKDLPDDL